MLCERLPCPNEGIKRTRTSYAGQFNLRTEEYGGREVQNSFERKKSLSSTKKVFRAQKKCLKRKKKSFKHKKNVSITKKVFRAQKKTLAVVFQTKKQIGSCRFKLKNNIHTTFYY